MAWYRRVTKLIEENEISVFIGGTEKKRLSMVSKEFAKYLETLLFPVKLYELAHSDEVKSVFWSSDRIAVKLNTEILGKECFRPEIFNVADHKHVFRQLSYYGFTRTVREGQ